MCVLMCLCVSAYAHFLVIAGQEACLLLEHTPHFLPAFSPHVPGFPRLQGLSAEGRQQGALTLALITKRSSFASWALGHHFPGVFFPPVLLALPTGRGGELALWQPQDGSALCTMQHRS